MDTNIKSIKSELKKYRRLQILFNFHTSAKHNAENRYFLKIIHAIDILRLLPRHGEIYYKILYYNYLSPEIYFDTYEIISALHHDGIFLSSRTYFRYKNKALNLIAEIITATNSRTTI